MAQITSANIKQLRADVEAALKTIYAKHGVDITVGRISYNADSFRCKIEGIVRGASKTPVTPAEKALPSAKFYLGSGFKEGAVYTDPKLGRVKVTGYNSRARKYPFVITQLSTSAKFVGSLLQVNRIIERGEVA